MSMLQRRLTALAVLACLGAVGGVAAVRWFLTPPHKPRPDRNVLEEQEEPSNWLARFSPRLDAWPPRWRAPEIVPMLAAIARGETLALGIGWYRPGESRYGWNWLAQRYDANRDGRVEPREFSGEAAWFDRLDLNGDRVLGPVDFDWGPESEVANRVRAASRLLSAFDVSGDGRLSREEWKVAFERLGSGKGYVSPADMDDAPPPPHATAAATDFAVELGTKSRASLLGALFDGELGPLCEGPRVDQWGPDFDLPLHNSPHLVDGPKFPDGERVRLSSLKGDRPVVLVFAAADDRRLHAESGSIAELLARYVEQAHFLIVVIDRRSPKATGDRAGQAATPAQADAARQLGEKLRVNATIALDEGEARASDVYCAYPMRLYVLDRDGWVAYRGGRAPYAFSLREMEQALIGSLLELREPGRSSSGIGWQASP